MLSQTIQNLVAISAPTREDFYDASSSTHTKFHQVAIALIALIIIIILVTVIGYYLWNCVIAGAGKSPGLFTFAKPAKSMWEIFGLFIFSSLFIGGCCPITSPTEVTHQ